MSSASRCWRRRCCCSSRNFRLTATTSPSSTRRPTSRRIIGSAPFGAHVAYASFFIFGIVAYVFPFLLAAFGVGYLLNFLSYLRERRLWSALWSVVLVFSLTGLLHIMDGLFKTLRENIDAPGAGGWLGQTLFDFKFSVTTGDFGCSARSAQPLFISTLCFISLLFLTNFRLGEWIRRFLRKNPPTAGPKPESDEEAALERRARELEKQAKKLQEEVARSGLGADMQPVPEPTVRDLSVPQAKGPRIRKTTLPGTGQGIGIAPAGEGEEPTLRAKFAAATTEEFSAEKRNRKIRRKPKPTPNRKKLSRKNRRAESRTGHSHCRRFRRRPNPERPRNPSPSPSPRRR